jgi:LPXTG-site transpeptidase (sortase) family protein
VTSPLFDGTPRTGKEAWTATGASWLAGDPEPVTASAEPPWRAGDADTTVIPALRPVGDADTAVIPAVRPVGDNEPVTAGTREGQEWMLSRESVADRVAPGPDRREPGVPPAGGRVTRSQALIIAARSVGELMVTFGLILLLFAAYEIWGKTAIINNHQADLETQLNQAWGQDPNLTDPTVGGGIGSTKGSAGAVATSQGIARMYIPRLHNHWVVVQGITMWDIRFAPGHYPGTASPGQVGNFAVAGHRTPAIWWDLDQVRVGDLVVVQTRSTYYTYTVTQTEIVAPNTVAVIAPVPDHPGETPTSAMLTLTTCNPKWDNYQRLIVHGQLTSVRPVSGGAPTSIAGS